MLFNAISDLQFFYQERGGKEDSYSIHWIIKNIPNDKYLVSLIMKSLQWLVKSEYYQNVQLVNNQFYLLLRVDYDYSGARIFQNNSLAKDNVPLRNQLLMYAGHFYNKSDHLKQLLTPKKYK